MQASFVRSSTWSRAALAAFAAAPLTLASSAALAAPGSGAAACGNIELIADSSCDYVISGCTADCTPPNLVAACSGECTAKPPEVMCSGSCQTDCEAKCMVDPPSFDCTGNCEDTCNNNCQTICTDTNCQNDCEATCSNQCQVSCQASPGSADCTAECQTSCDASCTVEEHIDCHEQCSVSLQGGCQVACSDPTGALFCGGQYVDLTNDPSACLAYLASQGFNVAVDCNINPNGSTCTLSGCSATPGIASARDPLGIAGIAGMMVGIGLVASRRRRRA
jgi:hypothetical protein